MATNSINIFYSDIWLLCLILSYVSQQRSHALCDLIKIGARLTVNLGSYMTFMEVKSISKANWYSSFSSFCILIFTRFFYCTVPAASLFNVLQHLLTTLAISSWKLPAWVSSWPRCLGWVPKGDFNLHASWLLNFTNTFFVDLKTFFLHILSSAGRWFDTQTRVGPRSTNV